MGDPRSFPREKSSGASPKLAEDSDDDFMPDKHGNYREKKQVTVLHQRHRRRRNQAMHQQSLLKIVMLTLCQTSTETYRGKKVLTTLCTVSNKHYVVSYFQFK